MKIPKCHLFPFWLKVIHVYTVKCKHAVVFCIDKPTPLSTLRHGEAVYTINPDDYQWLQ